MCKKVNNKESERLSGLLALLLASSVLFLVLSVARCVSEAHNGAASYLQQVQQENQALRLDRIDRAVKCAVEGGNSCE
jgi:hypothetical protein